MIFFSNILKTWNYKQKKGVKCIKNIFMEWLFKQNLENPEIFKVEEILITWFCIWILSHPLRKLN